MNKYLFIILLLISTFLIGCSDNRSYTFDNPVLITESDFEEYMTGFPIELSGNYTNESSFTRKSIAYQYRANDINGSLITLIHEIDTYYASRNAVSSYSFTLFGVKNAFDSYYSESEYKKMKGAKLFGDEAFVAVIYQLGEPFGNVLLVRRGKRIHTLMFTGVYFDDSEILYDFVQPYFSGVFNTTELVEAQNYLDDN